MRPARSWLPLGSVVALAVACGDPGGPPGGSSGAGNTTIVLASSSLGAATPGSTTPALHPLDLPRALDEGARPCHVATDDGPGANGFCMTPLRVRGTANQISVWSSGQHVPGRLLGGGDSGMSGLFGYRAFDLAKGSALAGEDNLGETEVRFDILSVAWNHVETTFAAAGKTFTVRTVVISQPLFDEEAFDQCISDPGERERMEKAGEIFPGVRVRRGDVLVCVKDTLAECTDSDFGWVDRDTGKLAATRPERPVRLEGSHLTRKPSCSPAASVRDSDFAIPVFEMQASIENPFSLTAKNGPVRTYAYRDGATTQTGSKLTLTFDFDMASSVFWEKDPSTMTEADVLRDIDKVMLRPLRTANARAREGNGGTPEIRVKVSAKLE